MSGSIRPPGEPLRFAAVQRLRMLGTPAEERFDRITRLARRAFNVPICVIDIVGDTRIWLKSAQGFDGMEAPRETSYCQYTILHDDVCYIPDARMDLRLFNNPHKDTYIFYAGVPLVFDGEKVGVLCICDTKPRTLTVEDMIALQDLGFLAEDELNATALSESQLALAQENEVLAERALVDGLTRVWNRGAISEIAARELEQARTGCTPTGLLLMDIDHFKSINDTHGHPAGDGVLRQVSARLRNAVRPTDAVGRYGGEEFLVVLPNCKPEDLALVAERIRREIACTPVAYDGKAIAVTASLGGTVSHDGSHFVELLVQAADKALYEAKRGGRNRVCIKQVSPSMLLRAVKS